MKKLLAIFVIFVFLGTVSVSAVSTISTEKKITKTGTFKGEIGYSESSEWKKVGELSGTYAQKNKYHAFTGDWEITVGQYAGTTGTMKGIFAKNILYGKITISESGKQAPIIGFIGFKKDTAQFGGRFMSVVGPALYFKGTYQ